MTVEMTDDGKRYATVINKCCRLLESVTQNHVLIGIVVVDIDNGNSKTRCGGKVPSAEALEHVFIEGIANLGRNKVYDYSDGRTDEFVELKKRDGK